jgi:hypothetical protein
MISWPDLQLPPINLWSLPFNGNYSMNIGLGDKWEMRNGQVVTVIGDNTSTAFSVLVVDNKKKVHRLDADGLFIGKGYKHELDLVRKCV